MEGKINSAQSPQKDNVYMRIIKLHWNTINVPFIIPSYSNLGLSASDDRISVPKYNYLPPLCEYPSAMPHKNNYQFFDISYPSTFAIPTIK